VPQQLRKRALSSRHFHVAAFVPADRVLEAVVAPEEFAADCECGRAEDAEFARDISCRITSRWNGRQRKRMPLARSTSGSRIALR
jgi:hypothetical protein